MNNDEREAINQDGDEFVEYFGEPISDSEHYAYMTFGLFALIPLVAGIVVCTKLIFKWFIR